jgi:hypothetical protein
VLFTGTWEGKCNGCRFLNQLFFLPVCQPCCFGGIFEQNEKQGHKTTFKFSKTGPNADVRPVLNQNLKPFDEKSVKVACKHLVGIPQFT